MGKIINTDDIMTALCQHCDSHIEMCEECGMREIVESVPSAWIKCSERLQTVTDCHTFEGANNEQ